jgi:hypothetical protein
MDVFTYSETKELFLGDFIRRVKADIQEAGGREAVIEPSHKGFDVRVVFEDVHEHAETVFWILERYFEIDGAEVQVTSNLGDRSGHLVCSKKIHPRKAELDFYGKAHEILSKMIKSSGYEGASLRVCTDDPVPHSWEANFGKTCVSMSVVSMKETSKGREAEWEALVTGPVYLRDRSTDLETAWNGLRAKIKKNAEDANFVADLFSKIE